MIGIVVTCILAVVLSSVLLVKFIVKREASGVDVWVYALSNGYIAFWILLLVFEKM